MINVPKMTQCLNEHLKTPRSFSKCREAHSKWTPKQALASQKGHHFENLAHRSDREFSASPHPASFAHLQQIAMRQTGVQLTLPCVGEWDE